MKPILELKIEKTQAHPIYIGEGALAPLKEVAQRLLDQQEKVILVTDEHLSSLYLPYLKDNLAFSDFFVLPAGELAKSTQAYLSLISFLARNGLGRGGAIIAVGGGCVLDVAGFAAASYARGVPFYSVPTSLMAMADAAIGGKTGINLSEGKNLVGSFYFPSGLYAEPHFLKTLPAGEFNAGMAEVIKSALLGAPELWSFLNENQALCAHSPKATAVLRLAMAYKAKLVSEDPFELKSHFPSRLVLNLGHTFAHAIEAATGYTKYNHGEAVAIGLCMALSLSEAALSCPSHVLATLQDLLRSYALPIRLETPIPWDVWQTYLYKDKKKKANKLRFIGLRDVGEPVLLEDISEAILKSILL